MTMCNPHPLAPSPIKGEGGQDLKGATLLTLTPLLPSVGEGAGG